MTTSLERSRARLVLDHPWIAALALRLTLREDAEKARGTAATDGREIVYDPEFIATLTQAECDALYAHEALHCGWRHHERVGQREPMRANIAMDVPINDFLEAAGFQMPEGGVNSKVLGLPPGLLFEEVYDRIQVKQMPKGAGGGGGDGEGPKWGHVLPGPQDAQSAQESAEWRMAFGDAMTRAVQAGVAKGLAERYLEKGLAAKVDWRAVLAQFLDKALGGAVDYSWRRVSRRGRALGVMLPGMQGEMLRSVAVILDTSGSVSADDLKMYAATTRALLEALPIGRLVVAFADTDIDGMTELQEGMPFPKVRGGGGTDFRPALAWAGAEDFDAIVYITDLQGAFPTPAPHFAPRVVWLATTGDTAPFGCTIRIEA